jgi:6-phosphogluconolactonase
MPQNLKIEYFVEPDAEALARRAARHLAEAATRAAARGRARVAVSGGSTPKVAFQILADARQPFRAAMPWDKLDLFWVDERCVPPDHPDSNYRMTREAMLDHVPLAPAQIHRMEGELAPDVAAPATNPNCAAVFVSKAPRRRASISSRLAWGRTATPPRSSPTPPHCTR